jgi:Fe-S cluster assembly iron-binding protein IscA
VRVLAITEDAATAIDSILASSGLSKGAGLRITQEVSTDGGEARTDLRLSPVESPEEGDEVLDDVRIFLAPEAADLLGNRLLDADLDGAEFRFRLDVQA